MTTSKLKCEACDVKKVLNMDGLCTSCFKMMKDSQSDKNGPTNITELAEFFPSN